MKCVERNGILVPEHHTVDKVILLSDRYNRGIDAMREWNKVARKCVDFAEGSQWENEVIQAIESQGRKAFTFNEVGVLVRLVLGYQASTKTDIKILPNWQGYSNEEVAQILTMLLKQLSEVNQQSWVDAEVFKDGVLSGRGYYDLRLNFDDNELGELEITSSDPFSTILDPDGDRYNLDSLGWVIDDRWADIDEIEATYGEDAASLVRPLVNSNSGLPGSVQATASLLMPWRSFGGSQGSNVMPQGFDSYYNNAFDYARKNIRLIDCQHYVSCRRRFWLDLETGVKEPVAEYWTEEQIQRVLQYAEAKYSAKGQQSPIRLVVRPGKRVRWTTMVGDLIVYDSWSPYRTFTKVGFFPWFRRGKTRGMVEDLIGPQEAINKMGSAQVEIAARSANGGWQVKDGSLTPEEKERLYQEGSAPGYVQFWQGTEKPTRLEPGQISPALERLQMFNKQEIKDISGINDSALGQIDRVQSGVAVQARQRQSVIAIQTYMDNFSRTKELVGRKELEIIQDYYSEERVYRLTGDDGKKTDVTINKRLASGEIVNDVTNGRYLLSVDETPLASTFAEAQSAEVAELVKIGVLDPTIPVVREKILSMASIPNKEEFIAALAEWQQQQLQIAGQAQQAAQEPPKKPEDTIQYKDTPPDVQRQLEIRAGLQPSQLGGLQVMQQVQAAQPAQPVQPQKQVPQQPQGSFQQ